MSKCIYIVRSLAGLLLALAGVSRGQTPTTITNGWAAYDGFETPKLSRLWSTDRFEPGAVTMQTNIVRAGHSAAEITIHARDKFEAGVNGNSDSERAELREAAKLVAREGRSYEQTFSMFLPTNFPIVPTRLVIAQWKQYCAKGGKCDDDSPVLAIRYSSGTLKITQNINSPHEAVLYQEKGEFRGRWLDFKFRVRFSPGENGRIKAWLGKRQLVDFQGANANSENETTGYPSPGVFYFKMGLYRNVTPEPMTIYLDEYRKRELPDTRF
jgi:hypothetical protein